MNSEILLDLERWLNEEDQAENIDQASSNHQIDLYSFYEQLCVFKNEFSKINRKNADTLGRIDTEILGVSEELLKSQNSLSVKFDQLSRTIVSEKDFKKKFLVLIEIFDRLNRIKKAFNDKPKDTFLVNKTAWKKAWLNLQAGYEISLSHFQEFLLKEGFQKINCLGMKFDPYTMVAVHTVCLKDKEDNVVTEVISEGFNLKDEVFKLANVTVNKKGE